MLSLILFRGALIATPFVFWFVWRAWAIRNGRTMGATPWGWLLAIGAVLAGLSLMFSVAFQPSHRDQVYVPAEVRPDGTIAPGRYVEKAPAKP